MKICVVSAMFYDGRKIKVENRPEVVLVKGLRRLGHEVVTHHHWDCFDANEFDVVHVNHLGIGVLRAIFMPPSVPLVYTNHDLRAKHGSLSRPKEMVFKALLTRVDSVVALSATEASFLCERYGLSPQNVSVIYNGIDSQCFSYRRMNTSGAGAPFRILYVGQLIPIKGIEFLLRGLAKVAFDWTLDLVFHTADIRQSLESLVRELGITRRVSFVGKLSPVELALKYQTADVVAVSSLTESLPSVVTEAMLCGTPVIATDVGGIREQVSGYGVVIPPGDSGAITEAMNRLAADYETFAAQGPSMSAYARERFSLPGMVDAHVRLYSSLVERRRERRVWQRWPIRPMAATAAGFAMTMRRRGLL